EKRVRPRGRTLFSRHQIAETVCRARSTPFATLSEPELPGRESTDGCGARSARVLDGPAFWLALAIRGWLGWPWPAYDRRQTARRHCPGAVRRPAHVRGRSPPSSESSRAAAAPPRYPIPPGRVARRRPSSADRSLSLLLTQRPSSSDLPTLH